LAVKEVAGIDWPGLVPEGGTANRTPVAVERLTPKRVIDSPPVVKPLEELSAVTMGASFE
jgi:hypothetical protein